MSDYEGSSGQSNDYTELFETRDIVLACGAQFHVWDSIKSDYQSWIGSDFLVNDDGSAEYYNVKQGVHYRIRAVITKHEFKEALETPDLIVVYQGHSRHGNGPCFAAEPHGFPDEGYENVLGEHWGDGTGPDDGTFRMCKPFVCMPLSELRENGYSFAPVAIADGRPSAADRDAHAQGTVSKLTLPEDLRANVMSGYEDPDHQYWAVNGRDLLMYANWTGTRVTPYDLGATDIQCKVLCLFSCSTKHHFRPILRGDDFKAWQRDDPPTTNFAYFTDAPAPYHGTLYWIYYLLTHEVEYTGGSWHPGLMKAMNLANARLTRERLGFKIY